MKTRYGNYTTNTHGVRYLTDVGAEEAERRGYTVSIDAYGGAYAHDDLGAIIDIGNLNGAAIIERLTLNGVLASSDRDGAIRAGRLVVYWDTQDADNVGFVYRYEGGESGPLDDLASLDRLAAAVRSECTCR